MTPKLYWSDANDGVYRANLDGTAVEEVVADTYTEPGLALDTEHQKMYWPASTGASCRACPTRGSRRRSRTTSSRT